MSNLTVQNIKQQKFYLFLLLLLVLCVVASVMLFPQVRLFLLRAAGFTAVEAEASTNLAGVTVGNDANASGGRYILFGATQATVTPNPTTNPTVNPTVNPTANPTVNPTPTINPTNPPTTTPVAGDPTTYTAAQVQTLVTAYKASHQGNGGKDWDIIGCCSGASRTQAQIDADPAAVQLRAICGPNQLPIIPTIAWEYGGADHPWINPQASALVYCMYTPVAANSSHWTYNPSTNHVVADTYIKFPDQNPCKAQTGANLVLSCIGDTTNTEIFVDTASNHDGHDVGYELSVSTSVINLIQPNGTKVLLINNI